MARKTNLCKIIWCKTNHLPPERQSIHAVAQWFVKRAKARKAVGRETARGVWTKLLDHTMRFADEDDGEIKPDLEDRVSHALGLPLALVAPKMQDVIKKAGGRRPYGLFKCSGHAYGKVSMRDLAAICCALTSARPDTELDKVLRKRKGRIHGLALAGLSQIAHVLRPDLYPVLNGRTDFSGWQTAVSDAEYSKFVPLSIALRGVCDRLGFPERWRFKYLDRYVEVGWLIDNFDGLSEAGFGLPRGAIRKVRKELEKTKAAS